MKHSRQRKASSHPDAVAASRVAAVLGNRIFRGVAAICLLTFLSYWPALRAGFIWDDDKMLTANPFVRLPLGLYYIWCSTVLPDYYPLTSTSFWLEWRLWV